MSAHDRTLVLPAEVISFVFDSFTLDELFVLLSVCARWREIALNHPTYWSDIWLYDTPKLGALLLWLLRVQRTYGRVFSVTVDILEAWDPILTDVAPTIAAHLDQISHLKISVHHTFAVSFLHALALPAPNLEFFAFHVVTSSLRTSDDTIIGTFTGTVPQNLFQGHAPNLIGIDILSMHYDSDLPLPAFAAVKSVRLAVEHPPWDLPDIFRLFPSMKFLKLQLSPALCHPSFRDPKSWARIEGVTFGIAIGSLYEGILTLPLAQVEVVSINRADINLCHFLLDHLHGNLYIHIIPKPSCPSDEGQFMVLIEDADSHLKRILMDEWRVWEDDKYYNLRHDLYYRDDIASRIVMLVVGARHWSRASRLLLPLPNVLDLCVVFDPLSAGGMPKEGSIYAPKLACLFLNGGGIQHYVTPYGLAEFCRICLPHSGNPLYIPMAGVCILPGCSTEFK